MSGLCMVACICILEALDMGIYMVYSVREERFLTREQQGVNTMRRLRKTRRRTKSKFRAESKNMRKMVKENTKRQS